MRLMHVGLTVSNLKRSTEFYHLAFGFVPVADMDRTEGWIGDITGYKGANLRFQHMEIPGVMRLELIQYVKPHVDGRLPGATYFPGNVHFCLEVDDIEKWMAAAIGAGASVHSLKRPATIESGPNIGARVVYLRDPDEITIELFQSA